MSDRTWREVFDPKRFYCNLDEAGRAAREAGYKLIAWQGAVYKWHAGDDSDPMPDRWIRTSTSVGDL